MSCATNRSDDELRVLAGTLAGGVARELSRPIRQLREMLAVIVDALDHHVATAKGPTPYSWKQIGDLRDQVADAYLVSRQVARLTGDLAAAAAPATGVPSAVDVNKTLEAALNLARYQVDAGTEVFMDFGALPSARAVSAALLVVTAHAIVQAAESVGPATNGRILLRTRRRGEHVEVTITDNGVADAALLTCRLAQLQPVAEFAGVALAGSLVGDGGVEVQIHAPVSR